MNHSFANYENTTGFFYLDIPLECISKEIGSHSPFSSDR